MIHVLCIGEVDKVPSSAYHQLGIMTNCFPKYIFGNNVGHAWLTLDALLF